MTRYANMGGNSGVEAYEIGSDYITVKFRRTPRTYTYSYDTAGSQNIEDMKELAISGRGLNSFINRHVRNDFVK